MCRQVGIPAERQRLIFCGRVLGDEKRLREYEVRSPNIVTTIACTDCGLCTGWRAGGAPGPEAAARQRPAAGQPGGERGQGPQQGQGRSADHCRVSGAVTAVCAGPGVTRHIHVTGPGLPGHHHHHHAVGAIGQSSPLVRLNLARDLIRRAGLVMDRMEGGPGEPGVESGTEEQPPNQPQARSVMLLNMEIISNSRFQFEISIYISYVSEIDLF